MRERSGEDTVRIMKVEMSDLLDALQ
jgi:hypothetical protein